MSHTSDCLKKELNPELGDHALKEVWMYSSLTIIYYWCFKPTGSSVNPLTPLPVVSTTIVALPYKAYPAATKFRPGCKASCSVAGPSCD